MKQSCLCVLGVLTVSGASTLEAATNLNDGGVTVLTAAARDWQVSSTANSTNREPIILPYIDSHSVSQGLAAVDNLYAFDGTLFKIEFDQSRPGLGNSHALSEGTIYFSVSGNDRYLLSGEYSAVDPDPRAFNFRVSLRDLTTGEVLVESTQGSNSTPNESFVIGGIGGDAVNTFSGSLTGPLLAGHQYQFWYEAQTYAHLTDDGATASGVIRFVVPEPSSTLLFGLAGAISLNVRRRRKL